MSQIMYRRKDGSVGVLREQVRGAVLVGTSSLPEWVRLDATVIPFSSNQSAALPNVSIALDHLLVMLSELMERIGNTETLARGVDRENRDMVAFVRNDVAKSVEYMTTEARRLKDKTHIPVAASVVSNPALKVDSGTQQLSLDFSTRQSYDDSKSLIGANSIQGAFEKLASLVAVVMQESHTVKSELAKANEKIDRLERVVTDLATRQG